MSEAIIESAKENWSESDFDMFPSAFVYGGKKSNKFVVICDVIEKMSERADKRNNNRCDYDFFHIFIVTLFLKKLVAYACI